MTEKTEQPGAVAPGTIAIDPRVELLENHLLAQVIEAHLKNRNLVNAQQLFEERAKNAELHAAINLVQEETNKVVSENEELRKAIEQPAKGAKPGKKVN